MTTIDDGVLLAIDTATTRSVVALGTMDGSMLEMVAWEAGYRHGETLLPAIERQLASASVARDRIAGIVVGTGPGAFTGLRVGLATAKGLAHGLDRPIIGVPTGAALLAAIASGTERAVGTLVLLLPAGPIDRLLVRASGQVVVLRAGLEPDLAPGERLVAIDLRDRAPADAVATGEAYRDGLARELLRAGATRLAAGDTDDLAGLVPEYVTSPRGAVATGGEVEWSRDPR